MSDLQLLISKITSDIKSAEIGISMLEGYLQGAGVLPGPLVIQAQELPAPSLSLGENLRALRKQRKLTTAELGEVMKLAQGTLSGYENNAHEPDLQTLAKLADYFGVSVDYLLGRRGK